MALFEQKVVYNNIQKRGNMLINLCKNKKVLHVGCADWPIFNINNNLHYGLSKHIEQLDGYDINIEEISKMKKLKEFENLPIYSILPETKYDVILIPEVIEHVNNVEQFISQFSNLLNDHGIIYVSGPNAFCKIHMERNKKIKNNEFLEIVHPDHNCWYSLYTLPNTIKKCVPNSEIKEIGLIEFETMVYVIYKIQK